MSLTYAEENYLKAMLKLSQPQARVINTNAIAHHLSTSAASVTDMLKKLDDKGYITYTRYKGAALTETGTRIATGLVRRHRLWEVFLVEKLDMAWEEVHDIAEELEHIDAPTLIDKLDAFLGFPRFDPHGDPIPNAQGRYLLRKQVGLHEVEPGQYCTIVGVRDDDAAFLKHLNEKQIALGTQLQLIRKDEYDQTLHLVTEGRPVTLSGQSAQNIFVKPVSA